MTERELTRDEQFALLDAYAPVAVPREATDVHLRYQRFQDWSFDATFVLPRGAFEGYVRRLVPDDAGRFHGRRIGVWEGSVDVDAPGRRIHVVHSSS